VRLVVPGVLAVEVWDLPVGGKLLQEWRADPSFAQRLATVVRAIRDDPPTTFSAEARTAASRIARVHLVGGAVDDALCDAIAEHLPCTSTRDPFAAARAGTTLVPGAACADVGQSAIKLVDGETPANGATEGRRDSIDGPRTRRVERDRSLAPPRDSIAGSWLPTLPRGLVRTSTVRWLASLLAELRAAHIVVGLPCELVAGVPRSCSYCWPDPDPALVSDLARYSGKTLSVLNDAELGAVVAMQAGAPPDTLVLTIGFGVGGALIVTPHRPAAVLRGPATPDLAITSSRRG